MKSQAELTRAAGYKMVYPLRQLPISVGLQTRPDVVEHLRKPKSYLSYIRPVA